MEKEFHPLSALLPLLEGDEYKSLCEDIQRNGLHHKIWLYEGKIIDGRNRYRACLETRTAPLFRHWDGKGNPVDFVVGLNIHRRMMATGQRAMVAAKLARMRQGGRGELPQNCGKYSQAEAAALLNVSERTVNKAVRILKHGIPGLADLVGKGQVGLDDACTIADRPVPDQEDLVAQGPEAIQEAVTGVEGAQADEVEKVDRRDEDQIDEHVTPPKPKHSKSSVSMAVVSDEDEAETSADENQEVVGQAVFVHLDSGGDVADLDDAIKSDDIITGMARPLFLTVAEDRLLDAVRFVREQGLECVGVFPWTAPEGLSGDFMAIGCPAGQQLDVVLYVPANSDSSDSHVQSVIDALQAAMRRFTLTGNGGGGDGS